MSDPVGEEYLSCIEYLSFQSKAERRIAFLNILDFSTVIIHEVGENYFENLNISGFQDPARVLEYWNTIASALERVMDVEAPSDYQKFCATLKSRRDHMAHDVTEGIAEETLDELVATAPDWRDWLISQGKIYYETVEKLGAEELLVSQLQQDLQTISSAGFQVSPAFESELNNLKSKVEKTQEKLADMDPDTVTVSSDLADLILEIESLKREFERIESEKVDNQVLDTWEPIDVQIRKYSEETVEVEFEHGECMKLDLGRVSQDHTKPLNTEVVPQNGSNRPYRLRNTEPHTPVILEVVNPRDGGSEFLGEIKSVTVL